MKRNVDTNGAGVSQRRQHSTRHVACDPFQQTLPGHVHVKAETLCGVFQSFQEAADHLKDPPPPPGGGSVSTVWFKSA